MANTPDSAANVAAFLTRVHQRSPLVHNVTNFVAMNSSANILLALGASPVMAHAPQEVAAMVGLADALVLNIGTLDAAWIESMLLAGLAANAKGIPVVLDPVGAGATRYRTETARRILDRVRIAVLRGNVSELLAVAGAAVRTRGVDSAIGVAESATLSLVAAARDLRCVIAASGETDLLTDGERTVQIRNGHRIMPRITALGCGLSAVTGAFCAVAGEIASVLDAAVAAFGYYGVCGERAAARSAGPGTFFPAFLDELYAVTPRELARSVRMGPVPH
ncbi:MAG: hydroxyethylthiazole kinase [Kiritimatiellaeota bacterium]|nr:hydroxyethylthiazole kinase [Kiritimatiellota bacterium]